MRPPMRSSIACKRCRKSKIKCDNDGGSTACDACIKGGHNCTYPDPAPIPPKRTESSPNSKHDRERGVEKKRRKLDFVSLPEEDRASIYAEEMLSYQFLTTSLWDQLFNLYMTHFSTELPFITLPTLRERVDGKRQEQTGAATDLDLILLGILMLTARFHKDLSKYVIAQTALLPGASRSRLTSSTSMSEAPIASEIFATTLTRALGSSRTAMSKTSLERVQAYLMLCLYEWGRGNGLTAWMYLGVATRMAQVLRLGYGDKHKHKPGHVVKQHDLSLNRHPAEVPINALEVRRRTLFSCLILDRLLAVGDDRVTGISSRDLCIQLPMSETLFDLGRELFTGFLYTAAEDGRSHICQDDGSLARFIRLVDIWGDIARYSFNGGRSSDELQPWEERSKFSQLRSRLEDFYADFPGEFGLSPQTLYWQQTQSARAANIYLALHALGAVCQMTLFREHIPFIPLMSSSPQGPLDPLVTHRPTAPPGFWALSAEQLFKASRTVVRLIEVAKERLPYSSLFVYAIWQAGFIGLYALHFPWMDRSGHMATESDLSQRGADSRMASSNIATSTGPVGLAYRTLAKMAPFVDPAPKYLRNLEDMEIYYSIVAEDFGKHRHQGGAAAEPSSGAWQSHEGEISDWKPRHGKATSSSSSIPPGGRSNTENGDSESRGGSPLRPKSSSSHGSHTTWRAASGSFTAINNLAVAALHVQPPDETEASQQRGHRAIQPAPYRQATGSRPVPESDFLRSMMPPPGGIDNFLNAVQHARLARVMPDLRLFTTGNEEVEPLGPGGLD